MWEIAPKYDQRGLREQYVNGFIYRIGDIVESLHTGLVGKIIRRGTNHLICVTKEDYMLNLGFVMLWNILRRRWIDV